MDMRIFIIYYNTCEGKSSVCVDCVHMYCIAISTELCFMMEPVKIMMLIVSHIPETGNYDKSYMHTN